MSDNRLKKPYVEALKEIEKLKKEIKTLKEQALTWGEHARESQKAAREIEKDRDILKEQLARMGEYVESVQQELIAVDNPVCDQQPLIDDLENALSSYDPKWLEGVRAEALLKVEARIRDLELKHPDSTCCQSAANNMKISALHQFSILFAGIMGPINLSEGRQPNQSREKRG